MDTIKRFLTTKSIYRVPVTVLAASLSLLLITCVAGFTAALTGARLLNFICLYAATFTMIPLLVSMFASLTAVIIDAVREQREFNRYMASR